MTDIITNTAKIDEQPQPSFKILEQVIEEKIIHIYLSDVVGDPKDYIDIIHRIKVAGPNDTIFIYLNTPGGRLDTGVQIMSAIKNSQARIVCVIDGEVFSLGTMLFLAATEFVVHDHSRIMIHNHSGGQFGKGHEYIAQAQDTIDWFAKMAYDVYRDFLTEAEIGLMLDGKDFWIQAEEIRIRLTKMIALQEKRIKAKEAAEKQEAKMKKPTPKPKRKAPRKNAKKKR